MKERVQLLDIAVVCSNEIGHLTQLSKLTSGTDVHLLIDGHVQFMSIGIAAAYAGCICTINRDISVVFCAVYLRLCYVGVKV